jgi:hypothetical protein
MARRIGKETAVLPRLLNVSGGSSYINLGATKYKCVANEQRKNIVFLFPSIPQYN